MKTGTIRQTVQLPGTPDEVYTALMTTKGHGGFTGAPARISGRVGGTFTAWGDYIHGKNLELVPGKRILQLWRPTDDTWPPDHYSKVRFVLTSVRGGTRLRFTHSLVPLEHIGHLSAGWKQSYWNPLTRYLRAQAETAAASSKGRR